jgi:hypothetical protein
VRDEPETEGFSAGAMGLPAKLGDFFEAEIFATTRKRYFVSVIAFAGPVFTPYLES